MNMKDVLYCFDSVVVRINTFALRFKAPYGSNGLNQLQEFCEFEAAHLLAISKRIEELKERG